jgi:hypothetical protein
MLAWVVWRFADFSVLVDTLAQAAIWPLIVAVLLNAVAIHAKLWRWRGLLRSVAQTTWIAVVAVAPALLFVRGVAEPAAQWLYGRFSDGEPHEGLSVFFAALRSQIGSSLVGPAAITPVPVWFGATDRCDDECQEQCAKSRSAAESQSK